MGKVIMNNDEIIEDFRNTDYISFVEYLNDWFYEEETKEIEDE